MSQVVQGTTLMEASSFNIQVTETLAIQNDPKAVLIEDLVVAQSKDPAIREIKYFIHNKKLKWCRVTKHVTTSYQTIPKAV